MKKNVRTITVTDRLGRAAPADRLTLESSSHRKSAVTGSMQVKELREQQLRDEENSPHPDMARIARLRAAIKNLSGTIMRSQH